MTNTPPPNNNDDAANGRTEPADSAANEAETPVFNDVAAEHPEVQDAAPDLVEPAAQPASVPSPSSAPSPASSEEPVPLVEPATPEPTPAVPAAAVPVAGTPVQEAPTDAAEAAGYDEHIDEPRQAEQADAPTTAAPEASAAAASAPPVAGAAGPGATAQPMQTVYVTAPVAPKNKGNRGFGLLFAFLGTLVFAALFAGVIAIIMLLDPPQNAFGGSILGFIMSSAFWGPVAVYFVFFVLFALIINRGNWASWVLSSFLLAVIVYFASIGVILLFEGVFGMTPTEASQGFARLALSAPLIVVAIVAREVTIWFAAAIASRGRKVKERNLEARAAYERELDNQPLGFS